MRALVTERPIIFGAPMVRAILDGSKTQTRRLVKPQLTLGEDGWQWPSTRCKSMVAPNEMGGLGDQLWVKESWCTHERAADSVDGILFAADHAFASIENTAAADRWIAANHQGKRGPTWRNPMFMPRWASRITLEIEMVRVQRIQDISDADARAEGVTLGEMQPIIVNGETTRAAIYDPRLAYAMLWNSLNGKRAAWSTNPWVWAVTFRRVLP